IVDRAWSSRTWLIEQTVHTLVDEASTPLADRMGVEALPPSDFLVRRPVGSHQNDAGTLRQRLARLPTRRPALKRDAILFRQHQRSERSTKSHGNLQSG